MVWDSMRASEIEKLTFINNTMNKFQYLNILRTNLIASVTKCSIVRFVNLSARSKS